MQNGLVQFDGGELFDWSMLEKKTKRVTVGHYFFFNDVRNF